MTYLQPSRQTNFLNHLIIVLTALAVILAVSLIIIYSQTVSLNYNSEQFKAGLKLTQIQNAALQEQIFNLLSNSQFAAAASARGLVVDKNPNYLAVSP